MLYGAINVAEMRKEWCRRRRRRCARWLPHSPSRHRRRRANEGGREGKSLLDEGGRRTLPTVPLAPQETIELGYLLLIA